MIQISRVRRPKSAARKAYNRLSHFYDWLAGSGELQFIQQGLDMLEVRPGETVLEIGCGTGKALVDLCIRVGDLGEVHGLDLSPGMLQVAGARLVKGSHGKSAQLSCGDGANMPYSSGVFSSLFMSFTLELFDTPEITMVLAECRRVLKPDGRFGIVAISKSEQTNPIALLYEWIHAHLPTYVDCRPIHAEAMLQAAGFSIEKRLVKSMWGLPVILLVTRKA